MISKDQIKNTFSYHRTRVQDAYAIKQLCFEQSQAELQKEFGGELILDTIDDRTKRAWKEQWQTRIEQNRYIALLQGAEPEERYLEDTFFNKPALHYYIPPEGFVDDFNVAANIARAGHFFPKRFDLSIWFNKTLCGVSFSALETKPDTSAIPIDLIEANPDQSHPLKGRIGIITDVVAKNYARALQYKKIAYRPPQSNDAKKLHKRINSKTETVMLPSTKEQNYSEECFVQYL